MRIKPIGSPLPGEHLAATSPVMRPETDNARWRLRLDFWAGRALTAEALEIEQENRASQLTWRGRLATPGILNGLEIALETPSTPPATLDPAGHFIHVLPGYGLRADGEDIVVPRPLRVALETIPVHYVRIGGPDREAPAEPVPADATAGEPIDAGGFVYNVDTFDAGHQAWAAVLVLCPAEFRTFDRVDPEDPCELDPSQDAFADERRVDACVLRLCQLPARWEPPEQASLNDRRWRNRLANVILTEEAQGSARQQLRFRAAQPVGRRWDTVLRAAGFFPWDLLGVPLALLSSERLPGSAIRSYFLDRAVVARPGGRSRPRTRPAFRLATGDSEAALNPPGAGTPFNWRARVDQFAEHLGALQVGAESDVSELASRFQFVPPVGFLPRTALEFLTTAAALALPPLPNQPPDRAGVNHFFPASFEVQAVPVAVEDLDSALAGSAALEPYDLAGEQADSVRVLVPLPQRVFDPRLLVVEQEDPVFAQTVARFVATRQDWRQRRDFVGAQFDTMRALTRGPVPDAPSALDPGQVEPEPVEDVEGLGFTEALLSPSASRPPWEVRVDFSESHGVTATTALFLVLRVDEDARPTRIDVTWHGESADFPFTWTEPPNPPLERTEDEDGTPLPVPLPTPLWLRFTVTGQQLGASGTLTGFTLHLEDGRIGLAAVGQFVPGESGGLFEDTWWRAQDEAPSPQFIGDWSRISGTQLLAPFENQYTPIFPDGRTLDVRVADVEAAINPAGVPARAVPLSVATHGLERVLAELELEANEADDFIDAHFTRAQTNLYRIRKLVLGENAAQKLLINPAIAAIAEQETATATAEQLGSFLSSAKRRTTPFAEVNTAMGATAAAAPPPSNPDVSNPGVFSFAAFNFAAPNLLLAAEPVTRLVRFEPTETVARIDTRSTALRNVLGDRPEDGPTLPPRGLSIGQRFSEPRATQNLSYARAALTQFVNLLPRLRLPLLGQTVRSVNGQNDVSLVALQGRAVPPSPPTTPPTTSETIRQAAITQLFALTALTADTDEAEVTLAALDFTEVQSAILRTIEKVAQQRRNIITTGAETLSLTGIQRDAAAARVFVIEGKLAEARHDVSVARALRQEEQQRINEINQRRDALVSSEVKFLAYVRPRAVELIRRRTPYWTLDMFGVAAPVPACLQRHDEPPPPLSAYIQLFRHAPARWFTALEPLIAALDTPDKVIALLDTSRLSAVSFAALDAASAVRGATDAVQFTVLGAQRVIGSLRQRSAVLEIADKRTRRWKEYQQDALEHAAVGDLIAGRHGARNVSAAASAALEQIGQVATCLHAEFAAVTPAIRLAWIERYSQFDRPGLLRDFTVLPHYARLDRPTRRRLQEFADWLFGRVKSTERDAVNLINDLVRLCLLLASHAPVNRIIAGHVPRPTPVRPGIQIPIRPLNPELVRVGMEFHVWQASRVVARGRVEDLQQGEVTARVDTVDVRTTTLDTSMRVQFMAAGLNVRM